MITKVTGIILNTVPYKETSLVLNILTKEYGLIGVMARGVKSIKSPLRALVMPYTYGFFYIYYKEDKMSNLKEVDVINSFSFLHSDIKLLYYLSFHTSLAYQVYKESKSKKVYDLLISILIKMNEGLDPEVLTHIFEIKCLPLLGVGIILDSCVKCGNQKDIVTIDGDAGGYICKRCYTNERIVSLKTIQLLRMYLYIDIPTISRLNIKSEIKEEIDLFLNIYYNRYTGMYLKNKDFLKSINW